MSWLGYTCYIYIIFINIIIINKDIYLISNRVFYDSSNIINSVGALEKVARVVKYHHEHWDGSGYPDQLKGEEIPLGSRIVIIADCFEAMTSDRPYQKAMPKQKAVLEIQKGSGTQFDPKLVHIFKLSSIFLELPSNR